MNLRKVAVLVAAGGLMAGLLGAGVSASYTDSATAALNVAVGTFGCTVSSTDPNAVPTSGHAITFNLPPITSSAASSSYVKDLTVTNTGSMPVSVHWTYATGGTLIPSQWQTASGGTGGPNGMAYATDSMTTDATLAVGTGKTYTGNIGFVWTTLDNSYLGQTASVTYTANCGETQTVSVPAPVAVAATCANQTTGAISISPFPTAGVTYYIDGSVVTATSTSESVGAHTVTATASPPYVLSGYPTGGWSLTVAAATGCGNPPGFSGTSMTFTAGVAGSQVVNATPTSAPHKAVLSKTSGTLPFVSGGPGLTYTAGTGTNTYKATIAGTPGCTQIGTYPLALKATNDDPASPATETFNVNVVAPTVAPSLSFTMNSAATGSLGGPGANSFQVYGDIHNNSTSGGVWCSMTLSIPYTITSGFTPVVEPITSIWAVGSSSVSGGNIVVTIVNPYVTYSLFGPGGAKLNVPIIYLDGSPTYGATITLGTPVVTATQ
jgi:hypothetical protein